MTEPADREQLRYAWRALSVVCLASVLIGFGHTSFNVALPGVVKHFDASAAAASWTLLAFMLTSTVLVVVFGRLADMFGRRAMYLGGLAIFTLANLLVGFAPDEWTFIALRVLQAVGAAMILANSAALLTDAFPARYLGKGMGIYIASFSVAQLIGPTLGGFLTHELGWQWLFWSNVPVGLACMLWSARSLRKTPRHASGQRLDVPGSILVVLTLGSLLFGLSQAGEQGWADPVVLIGVGTFTVLLPLFVTIERRSASPVVDLTLLRDPRFAFGLTASFLSAVARMAAVLMIALFYQTVHGDNPLTAGLRTLPLAIATLIASSSSGFLHHRLSPRGIAVLGMSLTTAGLGLLLATVSQTVSYAVIAVALVVLGVGSGMFMPANTTALLNDLPSDRVGIVNSLRLMLQSSGVVIGTGLAMTLIASPLPTASRQFAFTGSRTGVPDEAVSQLVTGYRLAFLCMTVISLLALVASLAARRSTTVTTAAR